jgi:hypothetical protein
VFYTHAVSLACWCCCCCCCRSTGCGEAHCALCEHNQSRRCKSDLKPKYVSRDFLRASCGAPLLVGLVDAATGQRCDQFLPGLVLQVRY